MFPLVITTLISLILTYKLYQRLSVKMYINDTSMVGKVVIVTGSNTGIGYATAEDLAARGAKVILACRNPKRGLAARDRIIQETQNTNVIFRKLDLASFRSVREFAHNILRTESRLDVLINNAGTAKLDNSLTVDNLPIEAQINHFGPFLLTMLLLPLLKASAPSRIINVSSLMHRIGTINWLDKPARSSLQHRRVYANSKLANVLFTRSLAEKLKGTGVTVNCLHPGGVSTDIFRREFALVRLVLSIIFLTPEQGAQTSIFLAVSPKVATVTGKYFSNCTEDEPSETAQDPAVAEKLWEMSESVVYRDVNVRSTYGRRVRN